MWLNNTFPRGLKPRAFKTWMVDGCGFPGLKSETWGTQIHSLGEIPSGAKAASFQNSYFNVRGFTPLPQESAAADGKDGAPGFSGSKLRGLMGKQKGQPVVGCPFAVAEPVGSRGYGT